MVDTCQSDSAAIRRDEIRNAQLSAQSLTSHLVGVIPVLTLTVVESERHFGTWPAGSG